MRPDQTNSMSKKTRRSVTTLELFFDLVFVFTLTQMTAMLGPHLSFETIAQIILVFVNLFWMQSGYGWLTNQAPPNNTHRRILIIAGMSGFMVAALAIPGAFGSTSLDFALAYLFIVLIHSILYHEVAGKTVLRFAPLNIMGALALIAASFVTGPVRWGLWLIPVGLHYLTSYIVYRSNRTSAATLNLYADHFVERHGLLLLVALGESIVAIGIGIGSARLTGSNYIAVVLGIVLAATIWWSYFDKDAQRAEDALEHASPQDKVSIAIHGFFYAFIIMLLGIIALAAGIEHAISNAMQTSHLAQALLLSGGGAMYLIGTVMFRKTVKGLPTRYRLIAVSFVLACTLLGIYSTALVQLAALVCIFIIMLIGENRVVYANP